MKKTLKENKIQKRIVILIWSMLFMLAIIMLALNMIDRVNKDNLLKHIIAFILVIIVFVPSIVIYLYNTKNTNNTFFKNVIFIMFLLCAFVGIIESGFNSKKTQQQVQNLIQSIQNIKKDPKIKKLLININNQQEEYEIGDKISFDITLSPSKVNYERILYKIDNEIINVDLKEKQITCINDGICNITFYDSINKTTQCQIQIRIKNNGLKKIELNKNKDIFLKPQEVFYLNPTTNLSSNEKINLLYESSNNDIAIVDENGKITALKSGQAVIKCYSGDVFDEVFVHVDALTKIEFLEDEITILSSKVNNTKLKLYIDNIDIFKKDQLLFEYNSKYNIDIKIESVNCNEKYVIFVISNTQDLKEIDENINLMVTYKFSGGYYVEDNIKINIISGYDLSVENIDINKTKQKVDLILYYDGQQLVTKYTTKKIYYNGDISNYNLDGFKVTCDTNLKILTTTYNSICFAFIDEKNIDNKYFINFYPNKNKDEYVELEFNVVKKQIKNYDSSFELKNLYEENENLKNEIWYTCFNEKVFNNIIFNNKEFNNSGIVIIPNEDIKNNLLLEINEYGIVTKCELINREEMKSPQEIVLEFEICSLYEYNKNTDCKKYKYIVNIRSEYDDLLVSINGEEYTSENIELTVKKDDTVEIKSQLIAYLENKTNNKTIVSTSKIAKKYSNSKLVSVNKDNIKFNDYGKLEIIYYASKIYCEKSYELKVNISIVDENGNIPNKRNINFDIISYTNDCAPLLDKHIFSTGTKIKFYILESNEYKFLASNNQYLLIDEQGNAECLQNGEVTVYAINKNDENEIYTYKMKIYSSVKKIEIINSNYAKFTKQNDNYVIKIKNNKIYQFQFNIESDNQYQYIIKEYDDFKVYNDGRFQATKTGKYSGYILIGEENSPYKQKIQFVINSDAIGLSDTSIYFIRKLVGHFGLFMVLGMFGMLMITLYKFFNFKYKILIVIGILLHGLLVAYSTEFIQELDPTRTYAIKDILIDYFGYVSGVLLILLFVLLKKIICKINIKNSKQNV